MTSSDLKLHWKPCGGYLDGIGFRKFECFGRDEIVTGPLCQGTPCEVDSRFMAGGRRCRVHECIGIT